MVAMKLVVVMLALSVSAYAKPGGHLSGQAKHHKAASETSKSLDEQVRGVIDVLASSGIDNPFKDFAIRLKKALRKEYIKSKDAMEVFTVLIKMAVHNKTLFESRDEHLTVAAQKASYEKVIDVNVADNLVMIAKEEAIAIEAEEQLSEQVIVKAARKTSQPPVEQVRDVMDVLASSGIDNPFKDVAIGLKQGVERKVIESDAALKVFFLAIVAVHEKTLVESRYELKTVAAQKASYEEVIDVDDGNSLHIIEEQSADAIEVDEQKTLFESRYELLTVAAQRASYEEVIDVNVADNLLTIAKQSADAIEVEEEKTLIESRHELKTIAAQKSSYEEVIDVNDGNSLHIIAKQRADAIEVEEEV